MKYSFWKGLGKGIKTVLTIAAVVAVFVGVSDIIIWDMLEQHLKPILGSMTFGGAITMLDNYVKIKGK